MLLANSLKPFVVIAVPVEGRLRLPLTQSTVNGRLAVHSAAHQELPSCRKTISASVTVERPFAGPVAAVVPYQGVDSDGVPIFQPPFWPQG